MALCTERAWPSQLRARRTSKPVLCRPHVAPPASQKQSTANMGSFYLLGGDIKCWLLQRENYEGLVLHSQGGASLCDRVKGPSQTRVFAACVSQREGQQHMPGKVHIYARSKKTPRVPTARLTRVSHSQTCTNPPNRPRPKTHDTAVGAQHPPTHILPPITRDPRKRLPQQSLLVRTDNVGNNGVQKRGVPGPRDVKTTVQRLVRRARVQLPHTPCMPFASRPPLHALSQADPPHASAPNAHRATSRRFV